jgi:hypothetical protein
MSNSYFLLVVEFSLQSAFKIANVCYEPGYCSLQLCYEGSLIAEENFL